MHSFTLNAIGNLAAEPEVMARDTIFFTRFCLVAADYDARDANGEPRELVTAVWFIAFGALGEAIALNARKGDQLFVTAQLRAREALDRADEKCYGYCHIVRGFRFGAPGRARRTDPIRASRAASMRDPVSILRLESQPLTVAA